MYIPEHFVLQELFPKDFYNEYYPQRGDRLWELMDYRALRALDGLRKAFGTIIVNDWLWGGSNNYRGYRPRGCKVGARLSQHRFGRAVDGIPTKTTAESIREHLLDTSRTQAQLKHVDLRYITSLELKVHWLHFDVRNRDVSKYGIKTFEAI